jgi:excinuclease ABC subunit A
LQLTEAQMLDSPVHELLSGLQVSSVLDQIDQNFLVEGLQVLERFGLGKLSLDRTISSLSSGERLKLVAAFTELAKLTDTVFLFDEPGRIIFGQDLQTLLDWSRRMLAAGNTVLISGRAGAWVRQADRVLELGPGTGPSGGEIVRDYAGAEFKTAGGAPPAALSRKAERILKFSVPNVLSLSRRDIEIAENRCTAIVGKSGSGKTQLLEQLKAILPYEKGLAGRSSLIPWQNTVMLCGGLAKHRKTADPTLAELTGVLDLFADIFVSLPASRRQGLKKSDFLLSGGTSLCEACAGSGYSRRFEQRGFELCDYCAGKRFAPHILQLSFHEQNIAEVLALSVVRALSEFSSSEEITRILERGVQFGLGQIRLDTRAEELGNASLQRALLSEAIAKKNVRSTLYLLDQPFGGLDQAEVEFLMFQLRRETDSKSTFVFTTHDPTAIAMSDYVIELSERAEINFFGLAEQFSLSDFV